MKVLTNNQYYSEIANVIREQNGTNNTYTPPQMVSALKDLFYEEVEGVPPISFNGIGENLLDYRIDGASGGVGDRTKNLLNNILNTQTKNGVTFTVNEDKSVTCNGKNQNENQGLFITIGDYSATNNVILSGGVSGGNLSSYILRAYTLTDNPVVYYEDGNGVTLLAGKDYRIQIRIAGDYTCNNLTFYPMIRLATIEDNLYEPYGYKVPVVVSGKNLFDENSELNTNSTMDLTTGTFPGSTGDNKRTFFFKAKPNTTYTFSCDTIGDRLVICEYNRIINPSDYSTSHKITPNIKTFSQASGISEYSFTTSSTTKMVGIYYSLNTLPTNIQIEIGNIATDYEPYIEETTNIYLDNPIRTINDEIEYIDYSEQKQHRVRKNLLQNTATTQTINGVTFTVNNDKSITCNGTATGTTAITINTIFSINSTKISGCPMGGSWSSFELDLLNINTNNVDVIDTGNGAVIQNENSYRVRIRIASGYTCNNLTFYPMIRKADIEDDTYEPYIENTEVDVTLPAIPTLDGTNTLSIGTTVQPSNVYVKSRHESSYEAAMRERYEEAQAQLDALESGGE